MRLGEYDPMVDLEKARKELAEKKKAEETKELADAEFYARVKGSERIGSDAP